MNMDVLVIWLQNYKKVYLSFGWSYINSRYGTSCRLQRSRGWTCLTQPRVLSSPNGASRVLGTEDVLVGWLDKWVEELMASSFGSYIKLDCF